MALRAAKKRLVKIHTKISKNLPWLEKYLKKAKQHLPSLVLPRQIRSYKPSLRKEHVTMGACYVEERLITLATHRVITVHGKKRRKKKQVALSQKEILMTLAHEMAHLRHFAHTYEQEYYAAAIFRAFEVKEKCPQCKGSGWVPMEYIN